MGKKPSFLISLLIAAVFLAACQSAASSQAACANPRVLCVGLVTGLEGINDHAFNQAAWEGVLSTKKEKVADQVKYIETVDVKDYDQNIVTFAEGGYDVIVTVGDLLGEVSIAAAKRFPETFFIGIDQHHAEVLPNLTDLVFHEDQAGFLAGAMAAQLTKNQTVGAVLGSNLSPDMLSYGEGFAAGARYVNPGINILSAYHPGGAKAALNDSSWGASAAEQAIQNGADVIFAVGGQTGQGALIKTASDFPGVYCIGTNTDQWETVSEARSCLVTSAIQLIPQGVSALIKLANDGRFTSGSYYGDYALAPFHDFDSSIPQVVRENLSQVIAGLKDGSITTGHNPGK